MTDKPAARIDPATKKDELLDLPQDVKDQLAKHLELYKSDPAAAHMWDPICIGVPGGPVRCLMVTFTGRKSGKTMQTVLQYYILDGKYAVVGTRGGSADHPNWYLNLVATPECEIQVGAESHKVVARTLNAEERAKHWDAITAEQPEYLIYEKRTSRVIPVVVFD